VAQRPGGRKVELTGLALANADEILSVRGGSEGWMTSTLDNATACEMGAKSLIASYGTFPVDGGVIARRADAHQQRIAVRRRRAATPCAPIIVPRARAVSTITCWPRYSVRSLGARMAAR